MIRPSPIAESLRPIASLQPHSDSVEAYYTFCETLGAGFHLALTTRKLEDGFCVGKGVGVHVHKAGSDSKAAVNASGEDRMQD